MREIKFRAWIKSVKKIANWNQILEGCNRFSLLKDKDFIFMQYTGLKDLNNKEIFEGDIIKINDWTYIITWNNKKAEFVCSNDKNGKFIAGGLSEDDNIKISGNIYENPDLLENDNV